jgi:hypothetical protein
VTSLVSDLADRVTSTQLTSALAGKQDIIGPDLANIEIEAVTNLRTELNSKGAVTFLSNATGGSGSSVIQNASGTLRRIEGTGGIAISLDPTTDQVSVSGSALQTAVALKQDEIGPNKAKISIDSVTNLQAVLDSKTGTLLSALAGDGVSIVQDSSGVLRRLQGVDGIAISDANDQIRITGSALEASIATKQDVISVGGLPQDRVANLTLDLAGKASTAALDLKQDVISVGGLPQDRVTNLTLDLAGKASTTALTQALATKQNNLSNSSTLAVGTLNANTGLTVQGVDVLAALNDNSSENLYVFDGGTYTVLNLQHSFGINLAVTSDTNPSPAEILLSMDATSGVTINTSGHVVDNLSVGGGLAGRRNRRVERHRPQAGCNHKFQRPRSRLSDCQRERHGELRRG